MNVPSAIAADLAGVRFQAGVDGGRWCLVATAEPIVDIAIAAAQRASAPDEYVLRFDTTGYPGVAPTACPWNIETNGPLEGRLWPTGGRATAMFNPDWRPDGLNALYMPMDRIAMAGHDPWRDQHPDRWWGPGFTIVNYLEEVHDVLNATAYAGTRSPR